MVYWGVTCLCGYDEIVALPAELLDGCAHGLFALAASIPFRAVEEVYANVIGSFHASKGVFWPSHQQLFMLIGGGSWLTVLHMSSVGEPASQRNGGDLETRTA